MITKKTLLRLIAVGICTLSLRAVHADLIQLEIKNKAEITTANDLHLVFSKDIPFVPGDPASRVVVKDKDGNKNKNPGLFEADVHNTVNFDKGDLPSDIAPGGSAKVRLIADGEVTIDKTKSYWTEDGAKIVGALASLGAPPRLTFDAEGHAFAEFINPEPIPIIYTDILLARNNDLASFDIDDFIIPTGQLVTGILSSIVLDPGQSMLLSFGSVAPGTYQLAVAEVAAVSDPDDKYQVAAAAAVPEPPTLILLGVGFLLMLAYQRRLVPR